MKRRRFGSIGLALFVGFGFVVGPSVAAFAHSLDPREVISGLESQPIRDRYGVVSVERDPELDRLLKVRVDQRFRKLDPGQQRHFAESWHHLWKKSTPNGVFAVLDAESGDSLVSFDKEGRARLKLAPNRAAEIQPAPSK